MQITKEQVKNWHACTDGYRWFLEKFPQGGAYADVHGALVTDKRFDDAHWLVDKMYRTFLDSAEFIRAETAATDKMVGELTSMPQPSDQVEGENSSGDDARIGSSGNYAQIGSSGNYARIGSSGNDAQIGSSGNYARIGSSGNYAQIGSSGDDARIGSSGNYARIGSSGNYAQIGSSGNYARIGSSGNYAQIGSSGNYAQIGSSGYNARIGSSGNDAQIGSSGNYARISASGAGSVVACAGSIQRVVLGDGGCVAVPWYDGERTRFAVAYVGENGIEANTPYYLNDEGQFVKIEE
ncbi:Collagen triple helix repeat (20 copies) [Klebsiella pneumoniae subsp. rhinoscleromatis]|nr:Collagen triple helix repeat (20 copies) [Klebsiella pneumoniae subsp. rhinoscleromatis]